jgi:hypothetical protein
MKLRLHRVKSATMVLVAALAVTAASAACGSSSPARTAGAHHHQVLGSQREPRRTAAGAPMTLAAARRLPAGVFYILGGQRSESMNVWEVSRDGTLAELTRNRADYGIEEMSASTAGILVGDGLYGGEQDAMVTRQGVSWVRTRPKPGRPVYGFGVAINGSGQLFYLLAPGQGTDPSSKVFTYWRKSSPTGREHKIYSSRMFIGGVLTGPGGQVAIAGPSGQTAPGQKPVIVVISRSGHARTIAPGVKELGYPLLWGPAAPALVIPSASGDTSLIFQDGRRMRLPAGWQPWSWNPAGTELLMLRGSTVGVWSLTRPGQVTLVTQIAPGFEIGDISWLAKPARLGK